MTIIAFDGKTLAADKQATCNGLTRTVTKIRRIGDLLVAVAGDFDVGCWAFAWVEEGRLPASFPEPMRSKEKQPVDLLVIDAGRILKYECTPYPLVFEDKVFAMGSGRDYAMAAMHLGKSAREAAEVACVFDSGSGNGIDTLTLDQPEFPSVPDATLAGERDKAIDAWVESITAAGRAVTAAKAEPIGSAP